MATLLGARDLGLEIQWTFGFAHKRRRAAATHGVVYLDIGAQVAPGVIDHHHGGRQFGSTGDLVVGHPELVYDHLMSHWLAEAGLGRDVKGMGWSPRIVTHSDPDWDSIVAAHLTMRLVEDGGLPPYAGALAAYASEVDQGRARVDPENSDSFLAPHLCYLMMQHLHHGKNEVLMRRGLALLEQVVDDVKAKKVDVPWTRDDFSSNNGAAMKWCDSTNYLREWTSLKEEQGRFKRDFRDASLIKVGLPAADGGEPIEVKGFVAKRPMESALGKYLVRASGYPLSVIPLSRCIGQHGNVGGGTRGTAEESFPRVIISVDPTFADTNDRKPNLRGLGYALEKAESTARNKGNFTPRGTTPRWSDGSCDNDDPWYDGRGEEWTIVDSPVVGTVLDYKRIEEIVTQTTFGECRLGSGKVVLVWVESKSGEQTPKGLGIEVFAGIAEPLKILYCNSQDVTVNLQSTEREDEKGTKVIQRTRHFPNGTAPDFRMVIIDAGSAGTLEGLIGSAKQRIDEHSNATPQYVFGKVSVMPDAPIAHDVGVQFAKLGIGTLSTLDLRDGSDLALFNARALVLQEASRTTDPDPDLELFLYAAFLGETLVKMSGDIGVAVPEDDAKIGQGDTRALRANMLRFQAKYYQVEVSKNARGRLLFGALFESGRLRDHYDEVQDELERLAEIEQSTADAQAATADRRLQSVLFVVAVLGFLQTVIAVIGMDPKTLRSPWFISLGCAIVVIAALVIPWLLARRH